VNVQKPKARRVAGLSGCIGVDATYFRTVSW